MVIIDNNVCQLDGRRRFGGGEREKEGGGGGGGSYNIRKKEVYIAQFPTYF